MAKLQGNISAYMIGVVAGVTIVSTTIANKAKEQNEVQEQAYLVKKKQQRQKLIKALEHVVSTENSDNGTITTDDLKKYYYSNAFDVTADLNLAEVSDEFSEEKVRQEQIYKSYANMKKQAIKMYRDVIKSKSYMWTDTLTSYIKDAWNRDFEYKRVDYKTANLSFSLPWDNSIKKRYNISLPKFNLAYPEVQQQKLMASDASTEDYFGITVAIDGDTAVIGAPYDDTGLTNAGAAYIFVRAGGVWIQQQKIQAPVKWMGAYYGISVAIDGDTIVVGTLQDDGNGENAGAAYVYRRTGSIWNFEQRLVSSDIVAYDKTGTSVAIVEDTIVVGSPQYKSVASPNSGYASVFTRLGSVWTEQQKLIPSDAQADDWFAFRVAIDGDYIVASSFKEDTGAIDAGAVYIFKKSGSSWVEEQKIKSSNIQEGARFGDSIDIFEDTLVVGVPRENVISSNSGAVYVFRKISGIWSQQSKILPIRKTTGFLFGYDVAIENNVLIIGESEENTNGSAAGAAYTFVNAGSSWIQTKILYATDAQNSDKLGGSVALSEDTAIIGSRYEDTGGTDAGAAYIFVPED